MDDKRLNFGLPLHSARRFFSTLPFYKSELKSGPVCSPGTVPFGWEKSPGMPKTTATNDSRESSFEDCITEEAASTTTSTLLEDDSKGEEYSDAPQELSRTESFFFNCSLGGISALEEGADAIPFGMLSTDLKVQDLMMGRFLPAAKAMADQTPTHTNRKQPVKVKETMCITRNTPEQLRYEECKPYLSPNYAPELYMVKTDDEGDDVDRDCSLSEDHSLRGCGFATRFCFQAPFRIMNGVRVPATNLRAGDAIGKLHTVSSTKLFNTWSKRKYADHSQTLNSKIFNLGRLSSKASASPKSENSQLPTKTQVHRYCPRFSHDLSEMDTKRENDSLPGGKPSTSFRDLLARENDGWESRSNVAAVQKNVNADRGRKDESRADASESKTDHQNTVVIHPESSSMQGRVDSNRSRKIETPERRGDPLTTRLRKVINDDLRGHYSNLPLSPPLLNSPTESWLFRTLPFTPSPGTHNLRPSN